MNGDEAEKICKLGMEGMSTGEEIMILCIANVDFKCPHCGKKYDDRNEVYLKRINKNKRGYTWKYCENPKCRRNFGITGDMTGDTVSFKLKVTRKKI